MMAPTNPIVLHGLTEVVHRSVSSVVSSALASSFPQNSLGMYGNTSFILLAASAGVVQHLALSSRPSLVAADSIRNSVASYTACTTVLSSTVVDVFHNQLMVPDKRLIYSGPNNLNVRAKPRI